MSPREVNNKLIFTTKIQLKKLQKLKPDFFRIQFLQFIQLHFACDHPQVKYDLFHILLVIQMEVKEYSLNISSAINRYLRPVVVC